MIDKFLGFTRKKLDVIPVTEPLNHMTSHEMKRGFSYLIKEKDAKNSFEIFKSLVKGRCPDCSYPEAFPCESIGCEECTLPCTCKGCKNIRAQGLCFSLRPNEDIRQNYLLQTTPIFWISNHGQDSVSPSGLEVMANMIVQFLKKSRNPVVLLDGFEYLVLTNGFIPVFRLLRDVQEWIAIYRAIFLLPINPIAIEKKEMALVERCMEVISLPEKE